MRFRSRSLVVLIAFLAVVLAMPIGALAQTITIDFWHAMSGSRLQALENLVNSFNEAHPGIHVNAQFTGTYEETITRAIAAVRAGDPPHIIQVYEVGTQTMLDSGAIIPVSELAPEGEFDEGEIIGPIRNYYAVGGSLASMPFNSSTAMVYYNKDVFRKAGLDPNRPPTTYDELEEMGRQIIDSGAAPHVITFGWPAWIFEQTHASHSQPYANNDNGRSGRATEVLFNRPFGVEVLTRWTKWAQDGLFLYGGREYAPNQAFLAGQVAMLVQSTSSLAGIEAAADFEVGTTFLPRLDGYPRGNSVIGGATLWVMKGNYSEAERDAIWKFLKWGIQEDVTIRWHKETGYFPSTNAAVKRLLDERWFTEQPNHLTAFLQILTGVDSPESQGVLLGNFVEIRDIVDTALERAYTGRVSPQEALDQAAREANRALRDYNELYQ